MSRRSLRVLGLGCLVSAAAVAGCNHAPPTVAPAGPPVIPVSQPVQRSVTDYVDYTGRTAAVLSLDVRPRVSGYLVKMPFREGAEVKKGKLLFQIDPAPYQAQYNAANAQVGVAQAALSLAEVTYDRNRTIAARQPGSVSQQELDQNRAQVDQARANLALAQANRDYAKLQLDWTRVTSPIDGQVSRYYLTLGNLVNQDQTLLTTVVSVDPMYVYFDVDERTVLRVRRGINTGAIPVPADRTAIPVFVGLEGEEGYPHRGTLDFVNNAVTPSTATILARALFDNPNPAQTNEIAQAVAALGLPVPDVGNGLPSAVGSLGVAGEPPRPGRRLLSPGMFVRVRVPIGQPHPALLVIDRAVGFDQGLRFVYVVDAQNRVQYRRVTTGPLQDDGLRVIDEGLQPDDWVVVGALQQVRPRMEVEPERIPMPTLPVAGQAPSPAPAGPQPPPRGSP
jgi:multidrug efflux system membrane fusion protein